jgi:hypothetical protein
LTQVGPGAAMGVVVRRYWIPVLLREEIEGQLIHQTG